VRHRRGGGEGLLLHTPLRISLQSQEKAIHIHSLESIY